ncbi:transmembrane protein 217 [Alligator mississippiensis]|nr:transmembrane protein 217 [Alligator mississippiensis]XP_014460924.1 transmembrane protein 217 [Alligator mississippiensis]XP_019348074.1 transmembrane protein 217 [Alligator mississippiensis]XP_019348075.1 transmembrane protein 217 [Alligator mississippiensis]XP_019348076.1 transmembrane protein 217 [Alligator mississippiensis]XP_019348077.1 transmembrane protein 217 [Alligator mississippiensis]
MNLLCPGGFCGMTPRTGTSLAAIYMILMTNMYLIFETGHLARARNEMEKSVVLVGRVLMIPYFYYIAIALAIITYPVCILLIYSVIKRLHRGMFVYVGWIIFYDVVNCILVPLTHKTVQELLFSISHLEWFGLAMRLLMDCFWLSFVVTYALIIMDSKTQHRISFKGRRISRSVAEPPRFRLSNEIRKHP